MGWGEAGMDVCYWKSGDGRRTAISSLATAATAQPSNQEKLRVKTAVVYAALRIGDDLKKQTAGTKKRAPSSPFPFTLTLCRWLIHFINLREEACCTTHC